MSSVESAELIVPAVAAAEAAIRGALALNPIHACSSVPLANVLGLHGDKAGARATSASATQPLGIEVRPFCFTIGYKKRR